MRELSRVEQVLGQVLVFAIIFGIVYGVSALWPEESPPPQPAYTVPLPDPADVLSLSGECNQFCTEGMYNFHLTDGTTISFCKIDGEYKWFVTMPFPTGYVTIADEWVRRRVY